MKLHEIDEDEPGINLTPMIDVVFTLLVFFMLATTFAERERQLDIALPAASAASAPQPTKELVINVSRGGQVSIDGQALQGDALHAYLAQAAERTPGIPVTVRGDRQGMYDEVVQVLNECARAGLSNLALSTLDGG